MKSSREVVLLLLPLGLPFPDINFQIRRCTPHGIMRMASFTHHHLLYLLLLRLLPSVAIQQDHREIFLMMSSLLLLFRLHLSPVISSVDKEQPEKERESKRRNLTHVINIVPTLLLLLHLVPSRLLLLLVLWRLLLQLLAFLPLLLHLHRPSRVKRREREKVRKKPRRKKIKMKKKKKKIKYVLDYLLMYVWLSQRGWVRGRNRSV